ncbi:hypothetical protein PYW08_008170 [Mythimna loreyi]|uniref:Uncharacterized protein n=1 Tax=Mythimna loreyi TaxID=667449 RepID=A0ACC2QEM5_9NEOP|nr:hypothetical protein PYW08_008170 [Mythimna loreyi]
MQKLIKTTIKERRTTGNTNNSPFSFEYTFEDDALTYDEKAERKTTKCNLNNNSQKHLEERNTEKQQENNIIGQEKDQNKQNRSLEIQNEKVEELDQDIENEKTQEDALETQTDEATNTEIEEIVSNGSDDDTSKNLSSDIISEDEDNMSENISESEGGELEGDKDWIDIPDNDVLSFDESILDSIEALCWVVVLLVAPSLAQGSGGSALTSPCPSVFTYDPPAAEPGLWSGAATLSTDVPLNQTQLSIVLDSPALGVFGKLNNWTGNAFSQDNVKFIIYENDFNIDPEQSVMMQLFVQYDPVNTTPRLQTITLNGNVICDAKTSRALDNNSSAALKLDDRLSQISFPVDECGVVAGGNERFPLIFNGNFYKRGEIPWLVVIYKLNKGVLQRICGGTLVSDLHVLTAAHCLQLGSWFVTPVGDVTVKIGVHSLNDPNDKLTVTRKLVARYIHEDYDPFTLENDILILTLEKSVAGWGKRSVEDNRGQLDEPQMVRAPIVSNIECRGSKAVFHQVTYNTTLCAGYRNGTGPCSGDSGGGLYLLERGKWTLRGLASLSLQNTWLTCDLNEYVVFTDTAQFLPWIKKIMGDKYIDNGDSISGVTSPECGRVVLDPTTLAVNGTPTQEGQWPWHVALYRIVEDWRTENVDYSYFCGGTLVSHKHVITAAHCVTSEASQRLVDRRALQVHLGKFNLSSFSEDAEQIKLVKEIFVNPEYNTSTFSRDVAILKLHEPVTYTGLVRPACLWPDNETNLKNVIGKTGSVSILLTVRYKRQRIGVSPNKVFDPELKPALDDFKLELLDMLTKWKTEHDQMLTSWKNDQDAVLAKLVSDVTQLKNQCLSIQTTNSEIERSMTFINNQYEEIISKVSSLEKEKNANSEHINRLQKQIQDLRFAKRPASIEIRNIPVKEKENPDDFVATSMTPHWNYKKSCIAQ